MRSETQELINNCYILKLVKYYFLFSKKVSNLEFLENSILFSAKFEKFLIGFLVTFALFDLIGFGFYKKTKKFIHLV